MKHKDDDFLKQFRKDPPEAFGKRLYTELMRQEHNVNTTSRAETPILTPFGLASTPTLRRTYALPLVAATLMTLLVSVALLMSVIKPQSNTIGLAQTNEDCRPDIPADWLPYTVQSGDTLPSIAAQQGYGDEASMVEVIVNANCLTSADAIAVMDTIYIPDHAVITGSNIDRLTELTRYGSGSLYAVAWRPGADEYVIGGTQSLYFFDKDMTLLEQLPVEHGAERLAYSPDGAYLATTGGNVALLWDAETREVLFRFETTTTSRLSALAFSHDSRWLVATAYDGTIALMTTDGSIRKNYNFDAQFYHLVVHPTEYWIVTGTAKGIVRWGFDDTGALQRGNGIETDDGQYAAQYLAISPNGNVLASNEGDAVVFRHSSTLEVMDRFDKNTSAVHMMAFLPDNDTLLVGDFNEGVFYLNRHDGRRQKFFAHSQGDALTLLTSRAIVNPSVDRVVAIAANNTVFEYTLDRQIDDTAEPVVVDEIGHTTLVNGWAKQVIPAALPEQHVGLLIGGDGRGWLVDTLTGEQIAGNIPVGSNAEFPFSATNVAFSPDGQTFTVVNASQRLMQVYDLEALLAGQTEHIVKYEKTIPYNSSTDVRYTPDGRYLLVLSDVLKMWDMTGDPTPVLDDRLLNMGGHISIQALSIEVSPDGTQLAVLNANPQEVRLLDIDTGELIERLQFEATIGFPRRMMFTPDGKYLIVGGTSAVVIVDVEAKHTIRTLELTEVPEQYLYSGGYALSPDGSLLVGLGVDSLWAWDISDMDQIGELTIDLDPDYSPYSVAFTPDGRRLLVTTWTDDTLGILGIGQ